MEVWIAPDHDSLLYWQGWEPAADQSCYNDAVTQSTNKHQCKILSSLD